MSRLRGTLTDEDNALVVCVDQELMRQVERAQKISELARQRQLSAARKRKANNQARIQQELARHTTRLLEIYDQLVVDQYAPRHAGLAARMRTAYELQQARLPAHERVHIRAKVFQAFVALAANDDTGAPA